MYGNIFRRQQSGDERKSLVLLSVIGAKTYGVLCSILAPKRPQDKSYAELVRALTGYYEPRPLLMAERFYTSTTVIKPQESRSQSTTLNYEDWLHTASLMIVR